MGQLDPRFGPTTQNRTVTVEYLDELYDKADELRLLKRYLETLRIDIGGFDAWRSHRSQTSNSQTTSETDSMTSSDENDPRSQHRQSQRAHAALF